MTDKLKKSLIALGLIVGGAVAIYFGIPQGNQWLDQGQKDLNEAVQPAPSPAAE